MEEKDTSAIATHMAWRESGTPGRDRDGSGDVYIWETSVSSTRSGIVIGSILFVVNIAVPRNWKAKICRGKAEVLMWHATMGANKHRNQKNRPNQYPGRVKSSTHEHVYENPPGEMMARALPGYEQASMKEFLMGFAKHVNVRVHQDFTAPEAGEQMRFAS